MARTSQRNGLWKRRHVLETAARLAAERTLYADKGYHSESNRLHLRRKGIRCRIARPKIESRERLGRKRWVVERTIAWFHRFRWLLVRYERRADIHQAFLTLASCIILLRSLNG